MHFSPDNFFFHGEQGCLRAAVPWAPHPTKFPEFKDAVGIGSPPHSGHPFFGAPLDHPSGGLVWFGEHTEDSVVFAILRLFGWDGSETEFGMQLTTAENPHAEGYFEQVRFFSRHFVHHYVRQLKLRDDDLVPDGLATLEAPSGRRLMTEVFKFVERAKDYGDLEGSFSGTEQHSERLGSGLLCEQHSAVLRLWSRAWYCHK